MKNDTLISVIIPVYQVEQYLEQCLESVIHQTYQELEIILVDDGSYDKSGQICDQYAAKDSRILVIHKNNGGLVSARKAGLKVAKGELVAYVDSDDWIEADMYMNMYSAMIENDADIVVAAHYEHTFERDKTIYNYVNAGNYSGEKLVADIFSKMLYEPSIGKWGLSPACWDKLFKKKMVYDYQMAVDERIWDGEDHAFVYSALLDAQCVCVLDKAFYHHRIRENSVAVGYDQRCFERFSYLFNDLKKKFSQSPYWEPLLSKQFPYQMRWFLLKHIYTELGIPYYEERHVAGAYIFPFQCIEKGSKVILYGAGSVGKVFYRQLITCKYCDVIAWVAKDYRTCENKELVKSPEILKELVYDKIVIAALEQEMAESIRRDINSLGISEDRIVWEKPRLELLKAPVREKD